MTRARAALAVVALLLAGCGAAERATPPLWEVTGPAGAHGYLFGTIHALDDDVEWRSAAFDHAFADADTLVVEAAGLDDAEAAQRIWRHLALTPGLPPLSQRVPRERAAELRAAFDQAGLDEAEFADVESWAAALTLARELRREDGDGIDRALLRDPGGKRVAELEGIAGQLYIFDALPAAQQATLLAAVAHGAATDPHGDERLARLWRTGDVDGIAAETHKGMLADPALRETLLVGRNRAWAKRIDGLLRARGTPFVAVGAAHLAGTDGLPAMLAAQGYRVKRIQ